MIPELLRFLNANPGAASGIGAAFGGLAGGFVAGSRRVRKLEKKIKGWVAELMAAHETECLRRGWPTLTPPIVVVPPTTKR